MSFDRTGFASKITKVGLPMECNRWFNQHIHYTRRHNVQDVQQLVAMLYIESMYLFVK